MTKFAGAAAAALVLLSAGAWAGNRAIGEPVERDGMRITAAYIQPVTMDPQDDTCGPADGDIHLTAEIRALARNANGFAEGEWIPDLAVTYELTKKGAPFVVRGMLVPMVANSGPHYGGNVKLDGIGRYHVAMTVHPPSRRGVYRHTDKETGVAPWWAPFTQEWDFVFAGVGKKGGY